MRDRRFVRFSVRLLALVVGGVFLAAVSARAADGSLRGAVVDPLGGVVAGARVELLRDGAAATQAVTDGLGKYTFGGLADGRYTVTASAAGFEPSAGETVVVRAGETVVPPLVLQIGTVRQEVVVTATTASVSAAQVGASVTVLDRALLDRLNNTELLDPLRSVPGVAVVQVGQRGGLTSLFVRGGSANFNKVLLDGIPANDIGGAFDFANLSVSGVDRVEVLRGSNSVAYGGDAMTGVIDITTRRGRTRVPEAAVSADAGNLGTARADLSIGGVASAVDYFVSYAHLRSDNSVPNAEYRNDALAGRVGVRAGRTDISGTVRRFDSRAGSPNAVDFYGLADDSITDATSTIAGLTARSQWTDRGQSTIRFGVTRLENGFDNPSPTGTPSDDGPFANYLGDVVTITGANGYAVTGRAILDYSGTYPSPYVATTTRQFLSGQTAYQITPAVNLAGGLRVEHEHGQSGPSVPADATRTNYGGFVEGRGAVGSRLFVNGGIGFDRNAAFGRAMTPRVSVAAYLRPPSATGALGDTKATFNAGRGIKAPTIDQQLSSVHALIAASNTAPIAVDPIGPERSRTIDVGVEQGLARGRARVRLSYFDQVFTDLIEYVGKGALAQLGVSPGVLDTIQFGAYANAQSNDASGIELSGDAAAGALRVTATYTYLDARVTDSLSNGTLFPSYNDRFPAIPIGQYSPLVGSRPFRRPAHSGSVVLGYERERLQLSLAGYFMGKADESTYLTDEFFGSSMLLPNRNLLAGYQRVDLGGSYRVHPRARVYVAAANAFNERYAAAAGYPALPRVVRTGVTLTLGAL